MATRAVLFDFGHTLFDVREPGELVAEAARALGVAADPSEALRIWNSVAAAAVAPEEIARERDISAQSHRDNWVRLLGPLDLLADGLAEAVYAAHKEVESWAPDPDARPTLQRLAAAGVPVVIVSDTGFDLRPIFARHLGGDPPVDHFVLSFEHGAVKPAPVLFEAALAAVGVDPGEALMVGDNPITDGGASALGIPVLILPPARRAEPRGLDEVLRLAGR